jgi:predicted permease
MSMPWNDIRRDLVYSIRSLRKSPGFTLVALLTLALGMGANTAIFSVVNAVLLRPVPFRSADRLVLLWSTGSSAQREALTPARLAEFRQQMTTVSAIAALSHLSVNLTGNGDPERLSASSVSSSFFDVLGVPPLIGDTFHGGHADERDVVLSYGLWTRRFGSDRTLVGREITINGTARRVVAVMPASFQWPAITPRSMSNAPPPELWLPGNRQDVPRTPKDDPNEELASRRGGSYLRAVARVKDGVSRTQAEHEAQAIASGMATRHPIEEGGRSAVLQPIREQLFGSVEQPRFVLLGAVGFVLAIACANAASLLLGRAAARRKEIAVRLALGASRARIVRQLLTESVVLAFGGGGCGLVIAWWAKTWLVAAAPAGILRVQDTSLDARVLSFTAVIAVATGILFGIVPALQASSGSLNEDLAEGSTRTSATRRTGRSRDLLVAAEVCVALVLLIGAGLLLRSLAALSRVDTGITTRGVVTFDLALSGRTSERPEARIAFYTEALRSLAALPGVHVVAGAVTLPVGGDNFGTGVLIEGRPLPLPGQEFRAGYRIVTPRYFDAMGIPILAGRDFRDSDTRGSAPVVIVNETFARQQWPGRDAIGRRVRFGRNESDRWMTIVGVVGDVRHLGPAIPPQPEMYEPVSRNPFNSLTFVLRTSSDPSVLASPIRNAIAKLDPTQPITRPIAMDEHLARSLARPRFMATLVSVFGAVALMLSVVGIYGVMAYSVAQRAREIAIRSALGAQRRDVMRLVLSKALWLSLSGAAAGLAAASWLTRVLSTQLFGISATDPATYLAVALLLTAVALIAGAVPAIRALRMDGAATLRS